MLTGLVLSIQNAKRQCKRGLASVELRVEGLAGLSEGGRWE